MPTETTKQAKHSEDKVSLLGPLELTKEALLVYKNNFTNFLPLYLAFGLLSALSNFSGDLIKAKLLQFPLSSITPIVLTLLSLYLTVVFILALKNKVKNIELIDNNALRKIWPVFLLVLLYGLIVLGGAILLIIPAFIFATWYMFGIYILLTENLGIRDSLTKSKSYVKGHFWEVFRIQFSFGFLAMIFYVALYAIFVALAGFFFFSFQLPQLFINLITRIFTIPLAGFISPLGIIYVFLLYTHLKALPPAQVTPKQSSTV